MQKRSHVSLLETLALVKDTTDLYLYYVTVILGGGSWQCHLGMEADVSPLDSPTGNPTFPSRNYLSGHGDITRGLTSARLGQVN